MVTHRFTCSCFIPISLTEREFHLKLFPVSQIHRQLAELALFPTETLPFPSSLFLPHSPVSRSLLLKMRRSSLLCLSHPYLSSVKFPIMSENSVLLTCFPKTSLNFLRFFSFPTGLSLKQLGPLLGLLAGLSGCTSCLPDLTCYSVALRSNVSHCFPVSSFWSSYVIYYSFSIAYYKANNCSLGPNR